MLQALCRTAGFNTQPPEGGWIPSSFDASIPFCFNTQPPEGGWLNKFSTPAASYGFQHTAARRRLVGLDMLFPNSTQFQHTAARRRLEAWLNVNCGTNLVSTHSRPKAAGVMIANAHTTWQCFNTQPPEGGWVKNGLPFNPYKVSTHSRPKAAGSTPISDYDVIRFQHTAARRRLAICEKFQEKGSTVSTHSRPKAAGHLLVYPSHVVHGFNTQPPEGGWSYHTEHENNCGCFNTQPPEGGWTSVTPLTRLSGGFNTQPPEGGWNI